MKRRKILLLSPFEQWPLYHGTIVRTHHLARYLASRHQLWFAFRGSEAAAVQPFTYHAVVGPVSRWRNLFDPLYLFRLLRLVWREKIDTVVVSQLWSGCFGIALKLLSRCSLIFDNHNVEYLRLRRMGQPLWPLVALLEWLVCTVADQVLVVSEVDKRGLAKNLHISPAKITVVANGADVPTLQAQTVDRAAVRAELGIAATTALLLFFGSLSHGPNLEAVTLLLDEIVPRLNRLHRDWKLLIVGRGQEAFLANRGELPANVIFAGFADDIVPLIKSSDLVLVPLLAGSGTRYKILESIACGRRVVSTTIGAEGLDQDVVGPALKVVDGWDAFAATIAAELGQPPEIALTPQFISAYDWDHIWAKTNLLN